METKERTESKSESGLKAEVATDAKTKASNVMNPFVDWGFKYLFGTERSKKNLLGFLNLLLNLESTELLI